MISMKIYDTKEGQNCIEVFPVNSEGLVNFLYGKNKMRVSLRRTEVVKLINFLKTESENMPLNNGKIEDKLLNTII